jgi:hypothetical protein
VHKTIICDLCPADLTGKDHFEVAAALGLTRAIALSICDECCMKPIHALREAIRMQVAPKSFAEHQMQSANVGINQRQR